MAVDAAYKAFPEFREWQSLEFASEAFDRYSARLEQTKREATPEALDQAVQAATRAAAIDTSAIEGLYTVDRGFTMTVALETEAWQVALAARDESMRRAFRDALEGYEYVLDAATRQTPITESWIRQLHEVLLASQDTYTVYTAVGPQDQPLAKGKYKDRPNSPVNLSTGRTHAYAPPEDVSPEMHRLVEELRSPAFVEAHPVVQAAYAHYGFVCVHPFPDGNGRVARALASTFLYRKPGVPLVVFADQRDRYFDALEAADGGNYRPLNGFILNRVVDTIELVRLQIPLGGPTPSIHESLETLAQLQRTELGLTHADMDAATVRLVELAHAEAQSQLDVVDLPPGVRYEMVTGHGDLRFVPGGYRQLTVNNLFFIVRLYSAAPAAAQVDLTASFFPAVNSTTGADFVGVVEGDDLVLEIDASEIIPQQSHVLELKLSAWIRAQLARAFSRAALAAARRLRETEYLRKAES